MLARRGAVAGVSEGNSVVQPSSSRRPKISIITVSYNSVRTIKRTIESVLSQTYPNKEHIVIDGGSKDGTVDLIRRYANQLSYWTSEPDRGVYDAMNKGIQRASGEWIHLLNSDDRYIGPTALSEAVPHLDETRTSYFSMILDHGADGDEYYRFPFKHWKLYVSAFLPHPAMIISRTQYKTVGVYSTDYRIASDHDLILRMVQKYIPKHTDIPLVRMCQTGVSARNLVESFREFREVTVRHGLPRPVAEAIFQMKRTWAVVTGHVR